MKTILGVAVCGRGLIFSFALCFWVTYERVLWFYSSRVLLYLFLRFLSFFLLGAIRLSILISTPTPPLGIRTLRYLADERNLPPSGRIPEPEDIIGSVYVRDGKVSACFCGFGSERWGDEKVDVQR